MGDKGVPSKMPITGSGKVRKTELARLGNGIVKESATAAKL